MTGLHASVPDHVSSAIDRLERAFCTNTNVTVTIEDATVRVQSGAMKYMLGQARRLQFFARAIARALLRAHKLVQMYTDEQQEEQEKGEEDEEEEEGDDDDADA